MFLHYTFKPAKNHKIENILTLFLLDHLHDYFRYRFEHLTKWMPIKALNERCSLLSSERKKNRCIVEEKSMILEILNDHIIC